VGAGRRAPERVPDASAPESARPGEPNALKAKPSKPLIPASRGRESAASEPEQSVALIAAWSACGLPQAAARQPPTVGARGFNDTEREP
jgi:hypothetical protein